MKKIVSLVLAVLMLISVMPIGAFAEGSYETKEVTLSVGHQSEDGISVNSITPSQGWCLEDEFEIVAPEDYVLTRIEFRILYGDRGVPKFCGYTPKGIGVRGWYAVDFPFSDNIHSIKADKFDKYQYITEVKVRYHAHSIPSGAVWESDEANHWTFCSCGEKFGISEHNWAYSEYCDVCGRKIDKQCISKEISDFSTLKSAIDSLPNNYLVYFDIKNNIDVTEELEIKASGVDLRFTGPATLNVGNNRAFYIDGDNITLSFENVTIMGKHSFKGDGNAFFVDGDNCTISGVHMAYCGFHALDTALGNIERVNSWCGGAIDVDGENCTIKNCSFDRCYSQGDGGAIYIDDEGCVVSNCYMDACFAESDGGAIYVCYEQTNALIIDCKFYGYSQCKSLGEENLGEENNVYAWDNATVVNPDPYSNDETLFYNCTVFTKEEYEAIKAAPGKFVSTIAQGLGKAFGFSSTFSKGNGWIIAAGAVAIIVVAAVVISKKKKKAAVSETAEEATEETAETEEKEE